MTGPPGASNVAAPRLLSQWYHPVLVGRTRPVEPSDTVVAHLERPLAGECPGKPPAIGERIRLPGVSIKGVIDDVIQPFVVPAPAFEHLGARVLHPADRSRLAVNKLCLKLCPESRPGPGLPNDVLQDVHSRLGPRAGRQRRCRAAASKDEYAGGRCA